MSPETLFLASGNAHKIEELHQILQPLGIRLLSTKNAKELQSLGVDPTLEVEEDQDTLEGNALKKARFWAEKTGLASLSDDTGLEVDALGGEPGVYSARYAGPNATYADNVEKLLRELRATETAAPWPARFKTVVAYVSASQERVFEGVCEGVIVPVPSGSKGFGYDPVFKPAGCEKTFAELDADQKNQISHRGRATAVFGDWIRANRTTSMSISS